MEGRSGGERMESRVLHRQVFMPCRNKHKSLINVFYCCRRCTFYNEVNKTKKARVSNREKGCFFFFSCQTDFLTKRLTKDIGEQAHNLLQMIRAKHFATTTFFTPMSSNTILPHAQWPDYLTNWFWHFVSSWKLLAKNTLLSLLT